MRRGYPPDVGDLSGAPLARGVLRHMGVVLVAAAVFATVFTAWTPASLTPGEFVEQLLEAASARPAPVEPAPQPGEIVPAASGVRIGIVAGHSGPAPDSGYVDPGATCDDGLTELEVNQNIANLVVRSLQAAGYNAETLQEFDPRLTGYRAVALVSVHSDSCLAVNADATGYKITAAIDTSVPDRAQRLVDCLADRYGLATGLRYHPDSITLDMTEYHTFYEIHSETPAAIIETS